MRMIQVFDRPHAATSKVTPREESGAAARAVDAPGLRDRAQRFEQGRLVRVARYAQHDHDRGRGGRKQQEHAGDAGMFVPLGAGPRGPGAKKRCKMFHFVLFPIWAPLILGAVWGAD